MTAVHYSNTKILALSTELEKAVHTAGKCLPDSERYSSLKRLTTAAANVTSHIKASAKQSRGEDIRLSLDKALAQLSEINSLLDFCITLVGLNPASCALCFTHSKALSNEIAALKSRLKK